MVNLPLLAAVLAAILLLAVKWPFNKAFALSIFSVFLITASSTGSDYDYYKMGFESVVLTDEFPYVYTSNLTSEPVYLLYMFLGRLVTDDFNSFLAITFLLWVFIVRHALLANGIDRNNLRSILICALPALIPVVAYWSPRSALSLPMILFAYHFLNRGRLVVGLFFSLLSILFHSQYIPFVTVLVSVLLLSTVFSFGTLPTTIVVSAITLFALRFGVKFIALLPFLGEGSLLYVSMVKLHYFEELGQSSTIRLSGIVIIILDLIYLFFLRNRVFGMDGVFSRTGILLEARWRFKNLADIAVAFSLVANLVFIQDAHVAGRVARFADYFIMAVGLPIFVRALTTRRVAAGILAVYALLSLVVFKNIYIFAETY